MKAGTANIAMDARITMWKQSMTIVVPIIQDDFRTRKRNRNKGAFNAKTPSTTSSRVDVDPRPTNQSEVAIVITAKAVGRKSITTDSEIRANRRGAVYRDNNNKFFNKSRVTTSKGGEKTGNGRRTSTILLGLRRPLFRDSHTNKEDKQD
jgi:hypothetical protein